MLARGGFVVIAVLAGGMPVGAQGQAAIGAARGARTAVEQASEGKRPAAQAPAPAPAAPATSPAPAAPTAPAPTTPAPAPHAPAGTPPAQPPPAAPGQAPVQAAPATAASPTEPPIEPPGFTYDPDGRRDPFVSLVRRGSTTTRGGTASGAARPAGLGGLETAEVTLRGTVRSREGFVGILQGADQKTYIVRAGDKLFDGTVRTISQNDMVILQQVNDPLSLEKQREVRKVLRQAEAN